MTIMDGFTPAAWIWYPENKKAIFGHLYGEKDENGIKSQVYVNRNGDFIMLHGDGTTQPMIKILNESKYLCISVRNHLYPVHQILLFTFKRDELPNDYLENKLIYDGGKDNEAYTTEHIGQDKFNYSLDNLTTITRRENRCNRIFGSKNEANLQRIGPDARYQIRRTRKMKRDKINRDDKKLYKAYIDDEKDFIEDYK